MKDRILLGTELKPNIHIEPIGGLTMDDYDFKVEVSCMTRKSVTIEKKDAIRVDSNNYTLCVDTMEIGAGKVYCKITAYIPDSDFPDGIRTEVRGINTDMEIYSR